jgi:hypothetical protein
MVDHHSVVFSIKQYEIMNLPMYRILFSLGFDQAIRGAEEAMKMMTTLAAAQDLKLFEPDTLAPEQFYATLRRNHFVDPERRLMAAILEDAMACLSKDPHGYPRQHRKHFVEAYAWINANESEEWIFSFANICDTLGFDPSYLRRGLNRWSALNHGSMAKFRLKKYRSSSRQRKLRFRSTG